MSKLPSSYRQVENSQSIEAPAPEKQLIGSRSRASGAAFEKLIEASCEVYKSRKLAYIEKTPEPMRPISRADRCGRFTAVYTATAQPDYKGTLPGGRAVVFEAKHTDSDTMKQERVTPAQAEALSMHYNLGALCFVLISIKDRCFAIPWEVWDNMKKVYGRKYITASDVKEYEVKIIADKGSVYLDFLSVAVWPGVEVLKKVQEKIRNALVSVDKIKDLYGINEN